MRKPVSVVSVFVTNIRNDPLGVGLAHAAAHQQAEQEERHQLRWRGRAKATRTSMMVTMIATRKMREDSVSAFMSVLESVGKQTVSRVWSVEQPSVMLEARM